MKLSTLLAWTSLVCTGFIAYKVMSNHVWNPSTALGKRIAEIGIVDTMGPFWDERKIRPLFKKYGAEGRIYAADSYIDFPWCDCLFPVSFSITLCLFLYINQSSRRWMCLFGLLYGASDFGENFSLMRLLRTFPDFDPLALNVGPKFTLAKNIFVLLSVLGIVQGFVSFIFHSSSKVAKKD